MSDSVVQEQEYYEKLDISVLSISQIKSLIKNDIKATTIGRQKGIDVERQCFHIIGPAGVGKTEIMYQISKELSKELFDDRTKFDIIMIKAPVISRDEMICPFPDIKDEDNESFKMLYSDFVPKDPKSYGIFVIDECERGDHSLQQLLWQIQNEYKVHVKDFPENWFVVTIDNPDTSVYQMDTMEDAAGLRRQLHMYVDVNAIDFLNHAHSRDFHPSVIEFVSAHPDFVYDFTAQKQGKVYSNPASWEKVSNAMKKIDIMCDGKYGDTEFDTIKSLGSGLVNLHMIRMFVEFLKEGKDINPKDIFYDYDKVRKIILDNVKKKENSKLATTVNGFLTYVASGKPEWTDKELNNSATFLTDVPMDIGAMFITSVEQYSTNSQEFLYVTKLHLAMMKANAKYKKDFYNAMIKLAKKNNAND